MTFETAALLSPPDILAFFRALADEHRLAIIRRLALTDLRVEEIVAHLGIPQNAVSYHLRQLRLVGLLHGRRSTADARDVYYRLDLEHLEALYRAAGPALYPGWDAQPASQRAREHPDRPLRVLFLCTHNSARSQLAEGLLRQMGGAAVEVASAGSSPTEIHPYARPLLAALRADPDRHQAKALAPFLGTRFDYIITVCDRVREQCPVFPGAPQAVHWSIPDPAQAVGESALQGAFGEVQRELAIRIRYLLMLPHPGPTTPADPGRAQAARPR